MALSSKAEKSLILSAANIDVGREIINAINLGTDASDDLGLNVVALIVATNVSTTIDFKKLKVGDRVLQIPAGGTGAQALTVATAGTLPEAAVVGDFYVVFRARTLPAASTATL